MYGSDAVQVFDDERGPDAGSAQGAERYSRSQIVEWLRASQQLQGVLDSFHAIRTCVAMMALARLADTCDRDSIGPAPDDSVIQIYLPFACGRQRVVPLSRLAAPAGQRAVVQQ